MEKERIYAVHDRELKTFLEDLGLWQKIEKQEIKCVYCQRTITMDNIGFILPHKDRVDLCCDDLKCYYSMRTNYQGASGEIPLE